MSASQRLALSLVLVAAAATSIGCSSTSSCSLHEETVDVLDGWVNDERTMYSSVDPEKLPLVDGGRLPDGVPGPVPSFTHFPANRILRFHIGLVELPLEIHPYLSFSPYGDATVAPCAGNQCLIRKKTKDLIVLKNDTCSEFWVWLTASTSDTPFHPVSDAGADEEPADADSTGAAGASGASGAP